MLSENSCCWDCIHCKITPAKLYPVDESHDEDAECMMDSENFQTQDGCRYFEEA